MPFEALLLLDLKVGSQALNGIPSFFLFQSGLELGSVTVVFERRPRESPQPLEDGDQPRAVEAIRERQKQRDGAHEAL